jgi:hypothetical protein
MSSFLQIETLWKFNAKYEPDWLPRYVVYDAAEHLVPVVLAILRAEALAEVPVIGRMIVSGSRKTRAQPDVSSLTDDTAGDDDSAVALLPVHDGERPRP